jgi:hypothetical protein
MSEAMELIVSGYVKVGNLHALQELQAHRNKMLETLSSIRTFDPRLAVSENKRELEIVRAGIAKLAAKSSH